MAVAPLQPPGSAPAAPLQGAVSARVLAHPLLEERDLRIVSCPPGATLDALVAAEWPFPAEPPYAAVGGRVVPREAWSTTVLTPGDEVVLRAGVRGGGGGGGKNPLRTVLQIGLLVASIYFPPLLGFNTFWTAVATAALVVGGTLIINALVPPATPEAAQPGAGSNPATEPVYSLTGGGNVARPYEPMALVLGEHRIFPNLAAPEYSVLNGPVQTVWQIYHFGVGDLEISGEKLGTNDLDSLPGITTQRSGQDGALTLAHGAVHTQPGPGDLLDTTRHDLTVPAGTVEVHISLVGRIFRIDDKGKRQSRSVSVRITVPGGGTRTVSLSSNGRSPVRRTLRYPVSGAGTTVSVQRASNPSGSERVYEELSWSALASVRRDEADYGGQTRYAIRAESSSQVSGRLQRFSALARQKVPVWRGGIWDAPEATSNPAWIFRWYALGYWYRGELVAGVGLPRARLDEEAIIDWGAWCEAQQLRCDYVLDRAASHDEVLRIIARCGRAAHTWQTGKLGVVWDEDNRPTGAMVAPGNIVAGSVSVRYAGGQAAEEIAVRFIDPDADWQWSTLRRRAPGVSGIPTSTATLTLEGVTTRRQAAVECNLQAARQVHHRRRISWGMSAEGLDLMIGDVVALTHSLIDGGVAGRLADGSTAARVILDRDLALDGAADSRMMFRPLSGPPHMSAVSAGDGPREIVLADPLPEDPTTEGAVAHDTLWRYYDADAPPARVRVVGVKPLSDSQVVIEAIDEVEAYYDAATSDLSAPIVAATLRPPEVLRIDVAENLVRVGSGLLVEIEATLTVAGDWRGGIVTASLDGGEARTVARLLEGETTARWLEEPEGALVITATPGTAAVPFGTPLVRNYAIVGITAPPAAPTNLLVDVLGDGTRRFRWVPPEDFDLAGIVIRYARGDLGTATLWEDQLPLHRGLLTASPWETVEPGPGRWLFTARAVDTGGRLSTGDVRIVETLGAQRLGDAVIWRCPGAEGWPGAVVGGGRSSDGLDALEGKPGYNWSSMSPWTVWNWGLGDGDDAGVAMTYTPPAEDLGATLTFALRWSAETAGTVVFEARVAATEEALQTAAWAAYAAGTTLTGRWLQVRWRLTGDGSTLLRIDHLCWSAHAPTGSRQVLDADTSDWAGSAAAGRVVPVSGFVAVTDLVVTLQGDVAGWTWALVSKAPPTIRIYDADRNPADATVDVTVRGVLA